LSKRFFFHVIGDEKKFEDSDGTVLSGLEAAQQQAATIANEIAQGGESYRGFLIYVVDEYENEVAQVLVGSHGVSAGAPSRPDYDASMKHGGAWGSAPRVQAMTKNREKTTAELEKEVERRIRAIKAIYDAETIRRLEDSIWQLECILKGRPK
jgi:hypothetical protein